jgi:hypothetical protein
MSNRFVGWAEAGLGCGSERNRDNPCVERIKEGQDEFNENKHFQPTVHF